MLLGVPMRELSPLVVALEDVLGPAAPFLVERLAGAADWGARFDMLDTLIGARLEDARPLPTWRGRGTGWSRRAAGCRSACSRPSSAAAAAT